MYISEIKIENFRLFGAGREAFHLSLNPGLTALVGENDAGKTAVVDALRFVLGTRDQESMRLESSDFNLEQGRVRAQEITIRLVFSGLTPGDRSAFAEYLTYPQTEAGDVRLFLTWVVKRNEAVGPYRRFMPIEWRTGEKGDGPLLDSGARYQLQATYLRPLRDAEKAMAAGRGSRLSQILQYTKDVSTGGRLIPKAMPPPIPARSASLVWVTIPAI